MTPDALRFTVRVDHNEHIPVGSRSVGVLLTISAEDPGTAAGDRPVAAEVIVIDTSASMTGAKIDRACQAAISAVEVLRDGTYFAVVAGQSFARSVYPARGLAVASPVTREEAARALSQVTARGGTSMSTWLTLTRELMDSRPDAEIRHAIMLTDGQNTEGEGPLAAALEACKGRFVCDWRGIGDDWSYLQLRRITRDLLGDWKPVAEPDELAQDFRAAMAATMAKRAAGVTLSVWTPDGAKVAYLARVMPVIEELTELGVVRDAHTEVFPLGDWGAQVADYHLTIDVGQEDLNVEVEGRARAARIELAVTLPGGERSVVATESIGVSWTEDIALSSRIAPRLAGYLGLERLAAAVDEGLAAWKSGDPGAREQLGEAVRLAHEHHREELLERLSTIVVIEDRAEGRIQLRPREQVPPGSVNWSSYFAGISKYVKSEDGEDGEDDGAGELTEDRSDDSWSDARGWSEERSWSEDRGGSELRGDPDDRRGPAHG